jgi:hypothetical protein
VTNYRLLQTESSSGSPENALDHVDGDPVDLGDLGDRHPVIHPGSDAGVVRPRDLTRGPGLGVDRCRNFLVAGRWGRQDREHARFSRGALGRWRGVRSGQVDGWRFRREERLGRLASARDPLTVITVRGLLLLPVIEQGSSRLFGCSRYRSGIRQLWQVVTADAGCHVNIKINKSP